MNWLRKGRKYKNQTKEACQVIKLLHKKIYKLVNNHLNNQRNKYLIQTNKSRFSPTQSYAVRFSPSPTDQLGI
jgi:hypothetical protein